MNSWNNLTLEILFLPKFFLKFELKLAFFALELDTFFYNKVINLYCFALFCSFFHSKWIIIAEGRQFFNVNFNFFSFSLYFVHTCFIACELRN